MLLKYFDDLAISGELPESESVKICTLVKLASFEKGKLCFKYIEEIDMEIEKLIYNDVDDTGNKVPKSFQALYGRGQSIESTLFGGSTMMNGGTPNIGMLKNAMYLRYSASFLSWLREIDVQAARRIEGEAEEFSKCIPGGKFPQGQKALKIEKLATTHRSNPLRQYTHSSRS